jgi:hypothetical protein
MHQKMQGKSIKVLVKMLKIKVNFFFQGILLYYEQKKKMERAR